VTGIVDFINARLDEDERGAVRAGGREWEVGPAFGARENMVRIREQGAFVDSVGSCAETWAFVGQVASIPNWRENAQHIARHDPARVLAEVDAKRRIIALADEASGLDMSVDNDRRVAPRDMAAEPYVGDLILRALALPYVGHPDYREEWTA